MSVRFVMSFFAKAKLFFGMIFGMSEFSLIISFAIGVTTMLGLKTGSIQDPLFTSTIIGLAAVQVGVLLIRINRKGSIVNKVLLEKYIKARGERAAAEKELALSLTYLNHYERKNIKAKVALVVCLAALLIVNFRFPEYDLAPLFVPLLLVFILITLKEWVVEYRIKRGLFGTTSSEVRDFINFLVQNSKDIDFTDSSGQLRKVLLPEEESSTKTDARSAADGAIA